MQIPYLVSAQKLQGKTLHGPVMILADLSESLNPSCADNLKDDLQQEEILKLGKKLSQLERTPLDDMDTNILNKDSQ